MIEASDKPGRLERSKEWGQRVAERALAQARRLPGAGIVEDALERDRSTAAALLSGGVAFRLFLWILPLGLVFAAIGSFWVDADRQGAEEAAQEFGLGAAAATSAADAIELQSHSRWYFLVAGLVLLAWFSMGAAKALRLASGVAWGERPPRLRRSLQAGLTFTGIVLAGGVLSGVAQWLRERSPDPGLGVTIALVLVYFGIVLWAMTLLPHRDAPWRALVPGAALVAVGMQVIHLIVVLYLTPKLGRSSELYGALGAATVILLWLYFVARLFVAGLFLNAARWGARAGRATDPAPAP